MRPHANRRRRLPAPGLGPIVSAAALWVAWGGTALADLPATSPESREVHAERLFREGEALFEAKQTAEACRLFARSQEIDPKLGTLLNLAFCHEAQGRLASAYVEYNDAAAWAAQRGQKEREEFARQRAAQIAPSMSRARFELPARQIVEAVELDSRPLPRTQWASVHFLDPGEHVLRVSATGKKTRVARFQVSAAGSQETILVLPLEDDVPPPAPRPDPALEARIATRRALTLVAGGVAAVGVTVGAVFGARTLVLRDTALDHCRGRVCDAEGASALDAAGVSATVADVAFGLALLGAGATIWLLATAPSRPATGALSRTPAVVPAVGLGAVSVVGRW